MAFWQGGSGAREAGRAGGGQATRSDVPPSPFHRGSRGDHDEGLPTAEKSFRDRFPRRVEGALWPSRGRIAAGRGGARAHQCRVVVGEPPTPSTPPDARQRDGATAVSLGAASKAAPPWSLAARKPAVRAPETRPSGAGTMGGVGRGGRDAGSSPFGPPPRPAPPAAAAIAAEDGTNFHPVMTRPPWPPYVKGVRGAPSRREEYDKALNSASRGTFRAGYVQTTANDTLSAGRWNSPPERRTVAKAPLAGRPGTQIREPGTGERRREAGGRRAAPRGRGRGRARRTARVPAHPAAATTAEHRTNFHPVLACAAWRLYVKGGVGAPSLGAPSDPVTYKSQLVTPSRIRRRAPPNAAQRRRRWRGLPLGFSAGAAPRGLSDWAGGCPEHLASTAAARALLKRLCGHL